MEIQYRQGILRGQIDPIFLTKQYLQVNSNYVNINSAPNPLIATAAHKNKNYTIIEHETVNHAWGPLPFQVNCLLYWDIDVSTGFISRGFTEGKFTVSTLEPSLLPEINDHWFDLNQNVMKVFENNTWVEKIRVFAGTFNTDTGVTPMQFQSQVGLNGEFQSGLILYDLNGLGIKDPSNGTFINTGDTLLSKVGNMLVPISVDSQIVYITAGEPIINKQLVSINTNGKVVSANIDDLTLSVAMSDNTAPIGAPVKLISSGFVFNDQWDFSTSIGQPVYLGSNGQISTVQSAQQIGTVINSNCILLKI